MAGQGERDIVEAINGATHEILNGQSDWGANMAIVDQINGNPREAERALEALMKRISNKKHDIGLSALNLVEALVKNCPCIHSVISTEDFFDALLKPLPSYVKDPTKKSIFNFDKTQDVIALERFDRTLLLIESWAKEFTRMGGSPIFQHVYESLLAKGVKFPKPQKDEMAPVFTPPVNIRKETPSKPKSGQASGSSPSPSPSVPDHSTPSFVFPGFRDKGLSGAVESAGVLCEMLTAVGNEDIRKNEIIQELVIIVKEAQKNVAIKLQGATVNEDELSELLTANDIFVGAYNFYDGLAAGKIKPGDKPDFLNQYIQKPPPQQPPPKKLPTPMAIPGPDQVKSKKSESSNNPTPAPSSKSTVNNSNPNPNPSNNSPLNLLDFFAGAASASASQNSTPAPAASQSSKAPVSASSQPSTSTTTKSIPRLAPPAELENNRSTKSNTTSNSSNSSTPNKSNKILLVSPPPSDQPTASSASNDLDLLFGNLDDNKKNNTKEPILPHSQLIRSSSEDPDDDDPFAALANRSNGPIGKSSNKSKSPNGEEDDPFASLAYR